VADYSHPLLPKHASPFRSPAAPPVTRSKRSRAVVVVEVTMHLTTEDRSEPSHLRHRRPEWSRPARGRHLGTTPGHHERSLSGASAPACSISDHGAAHTRQATARGHRREARPEHQGVARKKARGLRGLPRIELDRSRLMGSPGTGQ